MKDDHPLDNGDVVMLMMKERRTVDDEWHVQPNDLRSIPSASFLIGTLPKSMTVQVPSEQVVLPPSKIGVSLSVSVSVCVWNACMPDDRS